MAISVIDAASVQLTTSDTDVSDHVNSCRINVSNISVETRTMGNTWATNLATNQKNWTVALGIYNDYSTTGTDINAMLRNCLSSQASMKITARVTTNNRSASNPEFTGTASLDGEYPLMVANAVPEAPLINLTLKGNGTLTIYTSST